MKNKHVILNIFIFCLLMSELLLAFVTTYAFSNLTIALVSFLLLIVLLFIPCLLMRIKKLSAYFCFAALFFAFIPSFQPTKLTGLLHNGNLFTPGFTKERSLILLSVFSKELIMVLLLLFAICFINGYKIKKWLFILMVLSAICCIGMLFLPTISEVLLYWMTYLLIVPCFYLLEHILEACTQKHEKIPMWIFIIILFFRGIYQMLSILNVYPLM